MSAVASKNPDPIATRDITLVRTIAAPRELVFRMWTEREHLAKWWGPHTFTNPVCEIDARAGGQILIHMRAPDGAVHVMDGKVLESVPNERLVFTTSVDADGRRVLEGHNVVTFEDVGGKTRLTVQAQASGFVEIAKAMLAGMEPGWSQTLERLEAHALRQVKA